MAPRHLPAGDHLRPQGADRAQGRARRRARLARGAGLRLYADAPGPTARVSALQQENASLGEELARLRAELVFERATRVALEQQVTELNERSSELESQLNFFNAQSGRTRAAHSRD